MRRTINERKAWANIFIGSPIFIFGVFLLIASVSLGKILSGVFSVIAIFGSAISLFFSAYGLGWEYKRQQINEDANYTNDE